MYRKSVRHVSWRFKVPEVPEVLSFYAITACQSAAIENCEHIGLLMRRKQISAQSSPEVARWRKGKNVGLCGQICCSRLGYIFQWMRVCFCCVFFSFSVLSQKMGWEERLRNDLFCVGWDVLVQCHIVYVMEPDNARERNISYLCLLLSLAKTRICQLTRRRSRFHTISIQIQAILTVVKCLCFGMPAAVKYRGHNKNSNHPACPKN